jgi:hypothetical protein
MRFSPDPTMNLILPCRAFSTVVGTSNASCSPKMPLGRSATVASPPRPLAASTMRSPALKVKGGRLRQVWVNAVQRGSAWHSGCGHGRELHATHAGMAQRCTAGEASGLSAAKHWLVRLGTGASTPVSCVGRLAAHYITTESCR